MKARPRRPRRIGTAALTTTLALATLTLLAACGTTSSGGSSAAAGAGSSDVNTSLGPTGTVDSTQHIVCVGVCASLWPPDTLPAGAKPVAGGGVEATLATVQRPDGTWQVAVDGHPLYTYRGDDAAGQTKGQGVMDTGGTWYALSTSGTPLTSGATAMTSSSSSNSYGSTGYAHY